MKRSPRDGTLGSIAAISWLRDRGHEPTHERWHVEIALDVLHRRAPSDFDEAIATRFHVDIYAEEWGVYVCHGGRSSWIRVAEIAFVHGRDEFQLLAFTPPLRDLAQLLRRVESMIDVRFQRQHAAVTTNVPPIEPAIRAWIATL